MKMVLVYNIVPVEVVKKKKRKILVMLKTTDENDDGKKGERIEQYIDR